MTKVLFELQQKTQTVELPSYPGSEVEVKTLFTIGENRAMLEKFPNASDASSPDAIAFGFEMVLQAIVSWNFEVMEGDKRVALPINLESLRNLPTQDFTVLQQTITAAFEKKKQ